MKRVLAYKFPTWGIPILAVVGLISAYMVFVYLILSIRTPAIPSDIPRPSGFNPAQIAMISYFVAMAILDLILAAGLLMRWNKTRILTIILSPAPVLGVTLDIIYQTWVNQLMVTGPSGSVMQLQPLGTIASLLTVTGISFPSIAPLIGIYSYTSIPAIILALLNIATIIYLSNKHIKTQFKKPKITQLSSAGNTPTTLS